MIAGERWAYEEVEADKVPAEVRQAAEAMLEHCRRDLGLPPVRIVWIKKTEPVFARMEMLFERLSRRLAFDFTTEARAFFDAPLSGQVTGRFDDRMWVRCDQPVDVVVRTVAHEAMHLADHRKYRPAWTDVEKAAWEARASQYEHKLLTALEGVR